MTKEKLLEELGGGDSSFPVRDTSIVNLAMN